MKYLNRRLYQDLLKQMQLYARPLNIEINDPASPLTKVEKIQ